MGSIPRYCTMTGKSVISRRSRIKGCPVTRARRVAASCLLVLDSEQISCLGLHRSIYGDRVINCRPKSGHTRQVDFMCRWEGLEKGEKDRPNVQYMGPGKQPRTIILGKWRGKGPTNDSLPSENVVGSSKLKCRDGGQDPAFRSLLHRHVLERQSLSEVVPPSAISFSRRLPSIYNNLCERHISVVRWIPQGD